MTKVRSGSVTVYSVARMAGVSHTTVSRVLNGRPRIAERTRKKVLAAAEQLGYRPNRSAQALSSRRPAEAMLSVEVVLCQLSPRHQDRPEGYFMRMVRGCDIAARSDGNVSWHMGYWNRTDADVERRLAGQRNAGVILMGHVREDMVRRVREQGMMAVMADQDLPDMPVDAALPDNLNGGIMAARCLLERGYRRIGWLGGPPESVDWAQRLAGVRCGLAEAGMLIRPEDCRNPAADIHDVRPETYQRAIRAWLDEPDRPEALVLPCAWLASETQRAMLEKGLGCPEDLAMVCFDDDMFVSMCSVEPTRIDTRPQVVGQKAMERLIHLLRHPEAEPIPHKTVVPVYLIEGKSVGRR